MIAKSFFLNFLLIIVSSAVFSQNTRDTLTYQIETKDGNMYVGKIISDDSVKIIIRTDIGALTIPYSQLVSRVPVREGQLKDGVLWFDNPQSTRYFWAPNGYPLNPGEAYYQNVWIFFNQFAVGITRNFSVGAGFVPIFLFAGKKSPVWITPKFSIPVVKDRFNIAAGALIGTIIGLEKTSFGILYGNATFGSRDKNLSFGTGYVFAGGEFSSTPLFNLAAMIRITNRGYFLSENYFVFSDGEFGGILFLGGRSIIQKAGLDYGLVFPVYPDMREFNAAPWLGITIPFGKVPGG